MSILRTPSALFYTNPAIRPGLDALSWWLEEHHYSQHAREAILAHVAGEGTPTGCPYLEAEDEGPATEAFVSALPAVAYDSATWGDDGPDDGDRSIPADAVLVPPELLELAPIVGMAPEDEPRPFAPSPEDRADDRGRFDRSEPLYGYE
jgi:hypothetical protein